MTITQILIGEIIGTMLLVLFGDGVVAAVLLARSKAQNSGWIVIVTGWAMAVFVGVFCVASISGAHLNPAVTVGLAVAGKVGWGDVPVYIIGQFIGAFLGAILVWLMYLPHWAVTEDKGLKLAVFSTGPAIRNTVANLISEIIGTFALVFGVLLLKGAFMPGAGGAGITPIQLGALGALPVAFLVWGIGLSLGGPTGYAINPARDLGPRIMHAILPIAGKGDSDWGYAWIPVVGPLIGGVLGAAIWVALGLGQF
jgi:glycerol uptake facilitator protein